MDEPSAALTTQEIEDLFVFIRDMKSRASVSSNIPHRLDELFEITDKINYSHERRAVRRNGKHGGDAHG